MRRRVLAAALLVTAACASPSGAQRASTDSGHATTATAAELGSAARGLVYAQQACAACHAVETHQSASPNPAAPPFDDVANMPGMTGYALNSWLHTSHPTMPNFVIDADHVDDVAAYLATLRRPSH
jgi:mono/diheme cytochrome c family protein